jgi:hypothetical protein
MSSNKTLVLEQRNNTKTNDIRRMVDARYDAFYGALYNFIIGYFATEYGEPYEEECFAITYETYHDGFYFSVSANQHSEYETVDLAGVIDIFFDDIADITEQYHLDDISHIKEPHEKTGITKHTLCSSNMDQMIALLEYATKAHKLRTIDDFKLPRDIATTDGKLRLTHKFEERVGLSQGNFSEGDMFEIHLYPISQFPSTEFAYGVHCVSASAYGVIPESLQRLHTLLNFAKGHTIATDMSLQHMH